MMLGRQLAKELAVESGADNDCKYGASARQARYPMIEIRLQGSLKWQGAKWPAWPFRKV